MDSSEDDSKTAAEALPLDALAIGSGGVPTENERRGNGAQPFRADGNSTGKRGMLPELPYWQGKSEIINSAAFELL